MNDFLNVQGIQQELQNSKLLVNYPFNIDFKNICTFSDLPSGSRRKMKRFTATASQVAGCFSF
jgi:hypothetical protein